MNQNDFVLLKRFADASVDGQAALFIGAGLSTGSGYVDWATLLQPVYQELGIAPLPHDNLPELASWYVIKSGNNRAALIQHVVACLSIPKEPTQNHAIIPTLPINAIWTTNYDRLIERAFENSGSPCHVVKSDKDLFVRWPGQSCRLFKMHGDINSPHDIIITTEDYEQFEKLRPMLEAKLFTELSEKSFLFIGFSLTDPNFTRMIGRIRAANPETLREHIAVLTKETNPGLQARRSCEVEKLKSYNIRTIEIDSHSEITDILNWLRINAPKRPDTRELR